MNIEYSDTPLPPQISAYISYIPNLLISKSKVGLKRHLI